MRKTLPCGRHLYRFTHAAMLLLETCSFPSCPTLINHDFISIFEHGLPGLTLALVARPQWKSLKNHVPKSLAMDRDVAIMKYLFFSDRQVLLPSKSAPWNSVQSAQL